MTMHKSKGLEADVVFVYGGFSPVADRGVRRYTRDGRRAAVVGKGRRQAVVDAIKSEARVRGPAPLLRGADAGPQAAGAAVRRRRRGRAAPTTTASSSGRSTAATRTSTAACARWRRAARRTTSRCATCRSIRARPATRCGRARAWGCSPGRRPRSRRCRSAAAELARLARERLGPSTTSYSRIKHAGRRLPPADRDARRRP